MRKLSVITCIALAFVLLMSLNVLADPGGDGDPIPTSEFANRDWATYPDVKMAYSNDEYAVKYPKYIGESHIIKDIIEPLYNGTGTDIPRTLTTEENRTFEASYTFSLTYSVGFEFEGFSSGYDISASQTTTYSNAYTKSLSTTYTAKPGKTLYVYARAIYNVEAGEIHIYDRTGGDANTWRAHDIYGVSTPKNASSSAVEADGDTSHLNYWEYMATRSDVFSKYIQPHAQKYIDYINQVGTSHQDLTKDWSWSKPHNTDGDFTTGIFHTGIKFDWNLSTIHGAPQECIDYINNWNGVPSRIWKESYYSFN